MAFLTYPANLHPRPRHLPVLTRARLRSARVFPAALILLAALVGGAYAASDGPPPGKAADKDAPLTQAKLTPAEGKTPATAPDKAPDPPATPPRLLQTLTPEALKVVHPKGPDEMEALAKDDPLGFLKASLQWYESHIASYTCTFVKQEEVGGELLKTETMQMKFREAPFSVRLKWNNPSRGQEAMYVEGRNKGKVVVHPVGLLALLFPTARIEPTDERALKRARAPITAAGLANMLRFIIPPCDDARKKGDLELEYLGMREEGGRPAYVFKRTLPAEKGYPCHLLTIYIDQQFMIPIRTDAFNWEGSLLGHYRYMDISVNPPLTDDDFNPDRRF